MCGQNEYSRLTPGVNVLLWSLLREFCGANSAEQLTLAIFLDQVGRQMGSEQVLS